MNLSIAGMGWVTPMGNNITDVWDRLLAGDVAQSATISDPVGTKNYPVFRVPESALTNLPKHPRLRRASAISRFAAAAGLAALENARLRIDPIDLERTALVFAASNGGVIYTKRFYHDIVSSGAQSASPLLFPETVFNAPASHLAALLGISGTSYTIVGDGAVGVLAIRMAEDLMAQDRFDHCLVVSAEEADWILCDAYAKWRLQGTILSEGAGAILISRQGGIRIDRTHAGSCYKNRHELDKAIQQVLTGLATPDAGLVVTSANGTFIDAPEATAISASVPDAMTYSIKPALGESVGAGGLWQVIAAAQALHGQVLPSPRREVTNLKQAIVLSCGLNQQVAGLRVSI